MISVCLASFNGESHIRQQLESILQSPNVGEVLVSDDGSRDQTAELVRAFTDPRVRLLKGPSRGLISNFEFLLGRASGDLIFLSDQDDVWLPGKVEAMAQLLGDADLVVSDCQVVDADLRVLHPSFFALRGSRPGLWRNLVRNSYLGCCMAFRRSVLDSALPFPADVPMHDWWLGLVAQQQGRVVFLPRSLVLYRRHDANASSTSSRSSASHLRQLLWRWRLLRALMALHLHDRSVDGCIGRAD